MSRKKIDFFEPEDNSTNIDLHATNVFYKNYHSTKEVVINIGGGASSKSHSLQQLMAYRLLTGTKKNILIVRKTMPSLRQTVLIPFYHILNELGIRDKIREDKVGMNMYFRDNHMHFSGLDDPEKLKSFSYNYMWFEETTDITKADFNTLRLYLRNKSWDGLPNQIFFSFNPIDEYHWIKEYLIDNPEFQKDVEIIHSTYKDNPFIDDRTKQRYEELINQDINFYKIYTLGEWGKLENLIYKNWEIVEQGKFPDPKGMIVLYGIDFGFNDPTVITKCLVKDNDVWEEELLYQSNLTNTELINFMKANIPQKDWSRPFYCDAAEPARIKEIRIAGFNVTAAQKNIFDGLDFVRRFKQHVHNNSSNIIKELRGYSWKTDKRGHVIDEPVEGWDHSMDCIRYALYSHLRGEGVYRIRWIG